MKIYYVRHGVTQANIEKRYNGIVDEELSEIGIEKLNDVKSIYEDLDIDYVYCSPLKRCQQSFEILFNNHQINEIRPELAEMNLGQWAGRTYQEVFDELSSQGYKLGEYVNPPGGETYDQLFSRVKNFFNEIVSTHNDDETIVVMSHGLVIGATITSLIHQNDNLYTHTPDNGLGCVFHMNNTDIVEFSML